jgi:DNA polymerase-3 subunit gamma/tau
MTKRKPSPPPDEKCEYTVVARRYRPQQFADLVGQEAISQALTNALKTDRVAHAYLFTGTRGVGKTTTARILAKALNCAKGPTPTPCDVCSSCLAIASGEDVDVLEIDGASNRGIDEIRELRSNVQFRPTHGRYRIYIIDEVHMLTAPAFNALLKTLEEPPPHVKFIFATTDAHKVPITILSRCQRFDFPGISGDRIFECLKAVVEGEKRKADDDAIRLIARRAAGSMRDGQSLLDQLLAFTPDRLTTDQVHQMLGTATDDHVIALAEAILSRDVANALQTANAGFDAGQQPSELLDQLIAYWRDLMIVAGAEAAANLLDSTPAQLASIKRSAQKTSLDLILASLDVMQSAKYRIRGNSQPRVLVEMAIVRLCSLGEMLSISELVDSVRDPAGAALPQTTVQKPVAPTLRASPDLANEPQKKNEVAADEPTIVPIQPLTEATLPTIWSKVLSQLGMLFGKELERAGLPAISGPNSLVLSFPAAYNRQRLYCAEPSRLERVTEALSRLVGADCKLRVESQAKDNGQKDEAPGMPQSTATVGEHPLLRQIEQVLDARLMRMDDQFGFTASDGGDMDEETTSCSASSDS